jgi:predicted anti-sigma-YlaC factor YlaD
MQAMVRGILSTRDEEIDCGECFEQLDRFVELVLDGKDAAEALPLVKDHLDRCGDCREEFEALHRALQHIEGS